jgi:transposase
MRFVPIKSEEQQSLLVMHRARDLLVRQRTQLINAIRDTWRSSASSRKASRMLPGLGDMHEDAAIGTRPGHHRLVEQLGAPSGSTL